MAGCPFIPVDRIKSGGSPNNITIPKLTKKSILRMYSINIMTPMNIEIGRRILYSINPRNLREYL